MKNRVVLLAFLCALFFTNSAFVSFSSESELAKVMKQMLAFVKKEKPLIEAGKKRQAYPYYFQKMYKAKVTEGKKLSVDHDEYIGVLLKAVDTYYKDTPDDKRRASFNQMINACVTCHKRECPGPVQTIKQNAVTE